MDKNKILQLIAAAEKNASETECVEFKDGRGGFSGNKVWKTLSSFSHRPDGGIIVYGVVEKADKSFSINGVNNSALIQEGLVNYCREDMVGCLDPDFVEVKYKGKRLLVCIVHHTADEKKPCHKKSLGMHHGSCVRLKNVDKVISLEEAREFARNSVPFKYDHLLAVGTSFDDLALSKVKEFLRKSARKKGEMEDI